MIRGPIAVVLLVVAAGATSCKCNKEQSAQPSAAAAKDAAPARPRIPRPQDPDPDYEARRDELLRRGDPELMKAAPVIDHSQPPPEATATDMIKSVSKDVLMVREIKVDLAKRRLEIPGTIALQQGMLEFIAVTPAGKTYESLLTVQTTAVELRLALTLLGLEGAADSADQRVTASMKLPGGEVAMSDLLVDRKTGKKAPELAFEVVPFTDADKANALRSAQMISLVGHEPYPPLRVVGDLGNPYAGPDHGIGLSKKVPAVGTAVTLILTVK